MICVCSWKDIPRGEREETEAEEGTPRRVNSTAKKPLPSVKEEFLIRRAEKGWGKKKEEEERKIDEWRTETCPCKEGVSKPVYKKRSGERVTALSAAALLWHGSRVVNPRF